MKTYYGGVAFHFEENMAIKYERKVDAWNERNQLHLLKIDVSKVSVEQTSDGKYVLIRML